MSEPTATDLAFMRLALEEAALAARSGEVPVGAVVVHQGRVIARGHNQTLARQDITAHAEIQALRQACEVLGNHRLEGCELYVTLEPCVMCSGALMGARLRRLVYGAAEPKTGAAGSVLDVFANPRLNHHTRVHGGVMAGECAGVLAQFFQARREDQARLRSQSFLREDALRTPDARLPSWPEGLRSGYVNDLPELQGLRLHVLAAGQGGDAAVVLLHGSAQWSAAHAEAVVQLAKAGLAVYAPDLLGFGLSDKPKKTTWHSLAGHAAVLRAWLWALPQQRLIIASPPSMAALVNLLSRDAVLAERLCCVGIDEPALAPPWQDLPYPDAGHRAALRVMPRLLAPQDAHPLAVHLPGPDGTQRLLAWIASQS